MFKKQFSVPEKQTSITQEQILHDIEAIRKASNEENEENSFRKADDKREHWYADLKEFNNVSHDLVGALDDGGDVRDQLQSTAKDLKKISEKMKAQMHDILEQENQK